MPFSSRSFEWVEKKPIKLSFRSDVVVDVFVCVRQSELWIMIIISLYSFFTLYSHTHNVYCSCKYCVYACLLPLFHPLRKVFSFLFLPPTTPTRLAFFLSFFPIFPFTLHSKIPPGKQSQLSPAVFMVKWAKLHSSTLRRNAMHLLPLKFFPRWSYQVKHYPEVSTYSH